MKGHIFRNSWGARGTMGVWKWVKKSEGKSQKNNDQTQESRKPSFEQLESRLLLSASIAGTVWNDANANGQQDAGEAGLSGWTVELDNGATTTTDGNGHYIFKNLDAGTYNVSALMPNGWDQTSPVTSDATNYVSSMVFQSEAGSQVEVERLETDASGNTYVAGRFNGTVDFEPGTANNLVTSQGTSDVFVAKFNSDGSQAWLATWQANANDRLGGVAIDHLGNVYVTGTFHGNDVDMDPTAGVDLKTAQGWSEAFLTKINTDGSYGFTYTFGGSRSSTEGNDVAVDAAGNVFITGSFSQVADFNPLAAEDLRSTLSYNTTDSSLYVTRINANGSYGWTNVMGASNSNNITSAGRVWGKSIVVDKDGHVHVGGEFSDPIDFDPSGNLDYFFVDGNWDVFITHMESDGNYLGTQKLSSSGNINLYDMTLDDDGNLYLAGSFSGVADFDPASGVDTRTKGGDADIWYVTNLNADLSYGWTRVADNVVPSAATGVAVDNSGNVRVIVHAPEEGTNHNGDALLVCLDSSGQVKSNIFWEVHNDETFPSLWDVAFAHDGSTLYGGRFSYTSDLDPSINQDIQSVSGVDSVNGMVSRMQGVPTDAQVLVGNSTNASNVDFGARLMAPTVTQFTIVSPNPNAPGITNTPVVEISMVGVDTGGTIAGWIVTETNIQPSANDIRWSNPAPSTYSIQSFSEGLKTLYAWAKDNDGNVSQLTAVSQASIYLDQSAPVVTVSNVSSSDASPAVQGTIDDQYATVVVSVNGNDYQASNNGDGTWSLARGTISPALTSGSHTVSVKATDAFGRTNITAATGTIEVGINDLTISINNAESGEFWPGQSFSISVLVQELSGYAADNFDIQVRLSTDKTWSSNDIILEPAAISEDLAGYGSETVALNVTIPTDAAAGLYYIGVKVDANDAQNESDETNNIAWSSQPQILLNEADLDAPVLNSWDLIVDDGSSDTDKITSDTTPILEFVFSEEIVGLPSNVLITAPSGAQISPVNVTGWGTNTLVVTLPELSENGDYTVTLDSSIRDWAGNQLNDGSHEVVSFTIDTVKPEVTIDSLVTSDTTPVLSGTVSERVVGVTVTVNGETYDAVVDQDNLTWSLPEGTITNALVRGVYDVEVKATDLLGHIGTDTTEDELQILWTGYTQLFGVDDLNSDEYKNWTFNSTEEGSISVFQSELLMDDDEFNLEYSRNEATLTLDLSGLSNIELKFSHIVYEDFLDVLPEKFEGSFNGDGVVISVDGEHWVKLTDLDEAFNNRSFIIDDIIAQAEEYADLYDRTEVQIRFVQYGGDYSFMSYNNIGGRSIDNIQIGHVQEPEIAVEGNGENIPVNDDQPNIEKGTFFGRVNPGSQPVTRTFSVINRGYQPLTITSIELPTGYELIDGLPDEIGPLESAKFIVAMDTSAEGNYNGDIIINNNDVDEGVYRFAVAGTVGPIDANIDQTFTNDTTPELTGTVNDPDAVVTVFVNGFKYEATNNSDGTWTIEDDTIVELDGGPKVTYSVTVQVQNNTTGDSNQRTVENALVIDTVAPSVTLSNTSEWGDIIVQEEGDLELSGTVDDASADVIITIDENDYNATVKANGRWSLDININELELDHGRHPMTITARDSAGNTGVVESDIFVDTDVPRVVGWTVSGDEGDPDNPEDKGIQGDDITYQSQPELTFVFTDAMLLRAGYDPLELFTVFDITLPTALQVEIAEVVGWDFDTKTEVAWTTDEADQPKAVYALRIRFAQPLVTALNQSFGRANFQINFNANGLVDRFGEVLNDDFGLFRAFAIDTQGPQITLETVATTDRSPELRGTTDESAISVQVTIGEGDNAIVIDVDEENIVDGTWSIPEGTITPDLDLGAYKITVTAMDEQGNEGVLETELFIADFFEGFDGANMPDGWTVVNRGTMGYSAWGLAGGNLVQRGTIQSQDYQAGGWYSNGFYPVYREGWSQINHEGTFMKYDAGATWSDYSVRATLNSSDPDDIGIMFRYQNENNYYRFSLSKSGQFARLVKVTNGVFTTLAEVQADYPLNTDMPVRIDADGTFFQVFINGQDVFGGPIIDANNTHEIGTFAMYARANSGASFDDVSVTFLDNTNQAPVVVISGDDTMIRDDQTLELRSEFTHDPDNDRSDLTYRWMVAASDGSFTEGEYIIEGDVEYHVTTTENATFVPVNADTDQTVKVYLEVSDGDRFGQADYTIRVKDMDAATLLENAFDDANDTFQDGQSNGWTVFDEGTREGPSDWQIINGGVSQMSNIFSWPHSMEMKGTSIVYGDGQVWSDYQVDMQLQSNDDDGVGVMFRVQDTNNYYRFEWNNQTGERRLLKVEDGVFTELAVDNVPYEVGRTYNLRITALYDTLTVTINDVNIFSVEDSTFAKGTIGLYSWGNQDGQFRNLVVTNLEDVNLTPEITSMTASPSAIKDNEMSIITVVAIDGDNDALTYDWHVSDAIIVGDNDTPVIQIAPLELGDIGHKTVTVTVTVGDGQAKTVQSIDVLVINSDAQVTLEDNFDDGNHDGWKVIDQGTSEIPSNWIVSNGAVVQTSNIYTPDDGDAKLGTFMKYNDVSASSWTDVEITLDMKSTDNDGLGVMFRVQDDNNYYRLNWNNQTGMLRLEKAVNGEFTVLAEKAMTFSNGQTYQVGIYAIGDNLSVLLDGQYVLEAKDDSHATGTVAMYSWNNDGSFFDNVTVRDLTN